MFTVGKIGFASHKACPCGCLKGGVHFEGSGDYRIRPCLAKWCGKDKFWQALRDGKSGIRRITRFDPSGYPSQIAGEIPREWVEAVEPFPANGRAWSTHLIIAAARLALQDANISPDEFSVSRSGIMVGISTTDMGVVEKGLEDFKQNASAKAEILNSSFPHAAASELGVVFNCSGQVVTLSTGCPGGLFSLIYGAESIIKGEADLVIAGGMPCYPLPFLFLCFRFSFCRI